MKTADFNLEYFKYIRDEITKRVQMHYKLVLAKFVLTGALFAFLWKSPTTISISPFLFASIFSFLLDVVILENLGWIRSAGSYIKQNIESTELPIVKWEHDFAQAEIEKKWSLFRCPWRCFSPLSYLLGIWIIGAALWLGYLVLAFSPGNKVEVFLFVLDCYLLPYTGFLVLRNLAGEVPMRSKTSATPISGD